MLLFRYTCYFAAVILLTIFAAYNPWHEARPVARKRAGAYRDDTVSVAGYVRIVKLIEKNQAAAAGWAALT